MDVWAVIIDNQWSIRAFYHKDCQSTWPNQCKENLSSQRIHLGISVKCCHCKSHMSGSIRLPSFQKHLSIAGKVFNPETCSLADKIIQGTTNKHHPTQMHWNVSNTKHTHLKAIYDWKWLGSWKKKHLRNTSFLRIFWFLVTKIKDSDMNFVSHQNSCFAPLSNVASCYSFDQQPKSVRATLLQLYYHKMHILSFYVLYACPDVP